MTDWQMDHHEFSDDWAGVYLQRSHGGHRPEKRKSQSKDRGSNYSDFYRPLTPVRKTGAVNAVDARKDSVVHLKAAHVVILTASVMLAVLFGCLAAMWDFVFLLPAAILLLLPVSMLGALKSAS